MPFREGGNHPISPRSRIAPHDGVRWWIVSNVVCGVGKRACAPTVFTRSIYLRPVGTSLPAFSAAEIQIRQWPPLSSDSPRQISRSSASGLRSCVLLRLRPFGTRVVRPVAQPSSSVARNASPGGSSRTLPRTAVRASSRLHTSTPVPTNPFRQTDAALV